MRHARSDYNRIQDPAFIIPADEPVFLIRGKDMAGAAAVRAWALEAQNVGADATIIDAALAHAKLMDAWAEKQIPDAPRSALGLPEIGG